MPELPEVEIVRRGLERRLNGRRLQRVQVRQPDLRWPVPEAIVSRLSGAVLHAVERRGKYLLLDFGHGVLIVHLGMSGHFRFLEPDRRTEPGRHDHVEFEFEHGLLRYHDPRRFGAILWHEAGAGPVLAHPLLCTLGVEPLSPAFDAAMLHRALQARRTEIKSVLLAGRIVVGVGNIYASESLFCAGIRPAANAGTLSKPRCERLVTSIRAVLTEAIECGGSSLRDFVASDGAAGCYQAVTRVYGRAGQPCHRCGTPVRTMRQQGRSTFFCPRCQR